MQLRLTATRLRRIIPVLCGKRIQHVLFDKMEQKRIKTKKGVPDRTITYAARNNNEYFCKEKDISVSVKQRACCSFFPADPGNRNAEKRAGRVRGSLTVEAAIVLPLMIMAIWFLIFPLLVMESERRIQNRMETTARYLAVAAYIRDAGGKALKVSEKYEETVGCALDLAQQGISAAAIMSMPETKVMSMPRLAADTSILSDAEGRDPDLIHIGLEYELALPARPFWIKPLNKSLVAHRRAWTGTDGGRGRERYGDGTLKEDSGDRIVYIGKNSTRYHEDPHCHYLSNKMKTADASGIADLRNAGGARYHACPSCRPGPAGTVWYFENGTAYHSTENCKAITAYAKAVPLSEAEHLGPCSYCSTKH